MSAVPALSDLSTEWFTQMLRANNVLTTAKVRTFEISEIGQFSSQLSRIHLEYDRLETDAPTAIVAKTPRPGSPPAISTGFGTEVTFYQDIAQHLHLRLPRCYYAHHDPATGDALLLLEDVEDIVPVSFEKGVNATHARHAIDALADLHARWWQKVDAFPALPHLKDPLLRTSIAAAYERGWRNSREYFAATHDPQFLAIGDGLVGRVADSIAPLASPTTLLHGDAHFENLPLLNVPGEPRVFFHDWAATHYGHAAFDVAVFTVQSYQMSSRRQHEREVVDRHANAVRTRGIEWQDPWEDYRRGVLYWVIHMLEDAQLAPGAPPWIVIDRYVAAAVDLHVGELIV